MEWSWQKARRRNDQEIGGDERKVGGEGSGGRDGDDGMVFEE